MSIRTSASVKRLMEIKDVTEEDALKVKEVWRTTISSRHDAREAVDRIIQTCGVEYLGIHKRTHQHVYYCNAGETYATTILFMGPRLYVGCWGDLFDPVARVWEPNSEAWRARQRY